MVLLNKFKKKNYYFKKNSNKLAHLNNRLY